MQRKIGSGAPVRKNIKRMVLLAAAAVLAAAAAGAAIFLLAAIVLQSPAKNAVKLVEEDLGRPVNAVMVCYNRELNASVVEFTVGNRSDTAFVQHGRGTVGYESVYRRYEEIGGSMEDYPQYNPVYVAQARVRGEEAGWKRIQLRFP